MQHQTQKQKISYANASPSLQKQRDKLAYIKLGKR